MRWRGRDLERKVVGVVVLAGIGATVLWAASPLLPGIFRMVAACVVIGAALIGLFLVAVWALSEILD